MPRWRIVTGGRTFYVYAPMMEEAIARVAGNVVIGLPAGHWDARRGRLVTDEPVTLFEGRSAPGA